MRQKEVFSQRQMLHQKLRFSRLDRNWKIPPFSIFSLESVFDEKLNKIFCFKGLFFRDWEDLFITFRCNQKSHQFCHQGSNYDDPTHLHCVTLLIWWLGGWLTTRNNFRLTDNCNKLLLYEKTSSKLCLAAFQTVINQRKSLLWA